jgi:hypothetical protein
MNDAIGLGNAAAKAFQVGKIAAMYLGAGGRKRLCAGIGTGKANHFMTRIDEFLNYG